MFQKSIVNVLEEILVKIIGKVSADIIGLLEDQPKKMPGAKALSDPIFINVKPDLILMSRESEHRFHRISVLCLSPYFQTVSRLNSGNGKDGLHRIDMRDVDSWVADLVIRFAAYGRLEINDDNVKDLLPVADRYNMKAIVNLCQRYLFRNLNRINCFETYLLAHYYNCDDLKKSVANYVRINRLLDHNSNQEIDVNTIHRILNKQEVDKWVRSQWATLCIRGFRNRFEFEDLNN